MSFNENIRINPGRAQDRRGSGGMGGGGKIAIGGGAGGLILLLLAMFTGVDLTAFLGGDTGQQQQTGASSLEHCRTGADANEHADCRIVTTAESLDAFWAPYAKKHGIPFQQPELVIFNGGVNTGCGSASSDMGPFYCPADQTAYFDPAFFDVLRKQFGTSAGPLAQEYVVAHEYGHHMQNMMGTLRYSQQGGTGPTSPAVRVELQADCYAGMWAHHAATVKDDDTGETYLKPISQEQLKDAIDAAEAIGDDSIQRKAGQRVRPENFTHGTSEQRMKWFMTGYEHGDVNRCDTFNVSGSNL
ncbi:KPN_02809 family neutral zinc metallopeptidase [Micrococcoides hystricis]|uniref:Neutral zinc metallopeptidase n=1 Tax=Micrococcoides hystricis TaxID=1572761 RepID=A0ABV6P809_9MICC